MHNKTARMALTASTGDSVSISANNGTRTKTYTASIPTEYNLEKMSVLAFVQCEYGDLPVIQSADYGAWYVDNCRSAALGTTAPLEVE